MTEEETRMEGLGIDSPQPKSNPSILSIPGAFAGDRSFKES